MVTLVQNKHVLFMAESSGGGDVISDTINQLFGGCFGIVLLFFFVSIAVVIKILHIFVG